MSESALWDLQLAALSNPESNTTTHQKMKTIACTMTDGVGHLARQSAKENICKMPAMMMKYDARQLERESRVSWGCQEFHKRRLLLRRQLLAITRHYPAQQACRLMRDRKQKHNL